MSDAKVESDTGDSQAVLEGEYLGKSAANDDSLAGIQNLVRDASRYIAENPKKTVVILTVTTAAAVTAALATVAFIVAGKFLGLWRQPKS